MKIIFPRTTTAGLSARLQEHLRPIPSGKDRLGVLRTMTRAGVLMFLLAASGLPQSFPADLLQYLGLADAQVAAINQLNSEYQQTLSPQQQRTAQLQAEIAEQIRQETLDAPAIGVRYAEIESIRRDIAGRLATL